MMLYQPHQFLLPPAQIYLCGHSLGPMSYAAQRRIYQAVAEWAEYGVAAWNRAEWMDLSERLSHKIAHLLGCHAAEIQVGDSTSVNLYKALRSALALASDRPVILTEQDNFPSDLYIAEGIQRFSPQIDIRYTTADRLMEDLNTEVGVLMLTQVNYRSGEMHALREITQRAHELGILVLIDLSHSMGAIPLSLHADGVDFAVGCTYKYLNGGPGAPGFCYVHADLQSRAHSPILGWMGHATPFTFDPHYTRASPMTEYHVGTPTVFSLKGLEGALEMFEALDMRAFRAQSESDSACLIQALAVDAPTLQLLSPPEASRRGNHVAFYHPQAYALSKAMMVKGIMCDYRAPDLIRMSVNPLYINREDLERASAIIGSILKRPAALIHPVRHTSPRRAT